MGDAIAFIDAPDVVRFSNPDDYDAGAAGKRIGVLDPVWRLAWPTA